MSIKVPFRVNVHIVDNHLHTSQHSINQGGPQTVTVKQTQFKQCSSRNNIRQQRFDTIPDTYIVFVSFF